MTVYTKMNSNPLETIKMTRTSHYKVIKELADNYNYLRSMQLLLEGIDFRWSAISNVFIAPGEIIVVDRFVPFIYVAYDYEMQGSPYAVVRVSERTRTTHFDKMYSLN